MAEIVHELNIKAAPERIFAAITTQEGLSAWWTKDTEVQAKGGQWQFSDLAIARRSFG